MALDELSPELQEVARAIIAHYQTLGFGPPEIDAEAWPGANCRTTLLFRRRGAVELVEVRSTLKLEPFFGRFVSETVAGQRDVRLHVAVPHDDSAVVPVTTLDSARTLGLGILSVRDGTVLVQQAAVNCSQRFPMPGRRGLGRHRTAIEDAVTKYNEGRRLDALRDVTDAFEDAIDSLGRLGITRGKLACSAAEFATFDLEKRINQMAMTNFHGNTQTPLYDEPMRRDLLSFKGARNLGHHRRGRAENRRLNQQYAERMAMGIRLVGDIVAIQRQLAREP